MPTMWRQVSVQSGSSSVGRLGKPVLEFTPSDSSPCDPASCSYCLAAVTLRKICLASVLALPMLPRHRELPDVLAFIAPWAPWWWAHICFGIPDPQQVRNFGEQTVGVSCQESHHLHRAAPSAARQGFAAVGSVALTLAFWQNIWEA